MYGQTDVPGFVSERCQCRVFPWCSVLSGVGSMVLFAWLWHRMLRTTNEPAPNVMPKSGGLPTAAPTAALGKKHSPHHLPASHATLQDASLEAEPAVPVAASLSSSASSLAPACFCLRTVVEFLTASLCHSCRRHERNLRSLSSGGRRQRPPSTRAPNGKG